MLKTDEMVILGATFFYFVQEQHASWERPLTVVQNIINVYTKEIGNLQNACMKLTIRPSRLSLGMDCT